MIYFFTLCKDFGLPIKIYENENIFQSRLDVFENMFQSRTKWNMFVNNLVDKYNSEQEYLEQDNKLLDDLIDSVKNNEAYLRFNAEDFNSFKDNRLNYYNGNKDRNVTV